MIVQVAIFSLIVWAFLIIHIYFMFIISFALVVLEDLFSSRKELIDLEKIGKLLQITVNANS